MRSKTGIQTDAARRRHVPPRERSRISPVSVSVHAMPLTFRHLGFAVPAGVTLRPRTATAGPVTIPALPWPPLHKVGALLLATIVSILIVNQAGHGAIYPDVRVLDVPVGGLSEREAEARVAARLTIVVESPVTLTSGERVWTSSLADVGVHLDVSGSVAAAHRFGRDDHRMSGLLHRVHVARQPFVVPLGIGFDQQAFDALLARLETEVRVAPVDAALVVEGGTPQLQPGRDGLTIDREAVRADLLRQVGALQPISVPLITRPVPPALTIADLADAMTVVERALSAPLTLTSGDQEWSLTPEELGGLVLLDTGTSGDSVPHPAVILERDPLRRLVQTIATQAETKASDAFIDETGDMPRLVPAVIGRRVNVDALAAAVQTAFQRGEHTVALPVEETPPEVSTDALLGQLGITDLLSSGTSDFAGSAPNREQNIHVATGLVDLTLVPPGGVFSYNHVLGSIVENPGFVPAGATEGGVIGTSIGGGVCQVSTTVFRAALLAGLPIVEWWPHVHRSSFYEQGGWKPGFDASIAQGEDNPLSGSDFKFSNPTDAWMLVRATTDSSTALTVELYGSPTGYTVEIDDPVIELTGVASEPIEQVDPDLPSATTIEDDAAQDGATVVVSRRVLDADGNLISTDEFVSTYEPHGTVYRVSPDMAGTTGGQPV